MAVMLQPANGNNISIKLQKIAKKIINYTVVCTAVSRQQLSKHIHAATDKHATTEVLLEKVFPTQSIQIGYKEDN